jgi:hypothetical protein
VWGSGEAELVIGSLDTRDVDADEHAEMGKLRRLSALLDDMARAVTP